MTYHFNRLKRAVFARLALQSPKFARLLKAESRLVTMTYRGHPDTKDLIIFLPGIDDLAEDFARRGFIDDLRLHGIASDAIAVDAHYGYYASRAIHARITEDLVVAARSAGYEKIWLAGISLGGFGAATYAARNPSHVDGLVLFAPYLGAPGLVREIADAGGVRQWNPGEVSLDDYPRSLWAWMKNGLADQTEQLPIYLGYGQRDKFAPANALLAELLPKDHVYALPGGHDWRTWRRLWQVILSESSLTQPLMRRQ